MKSERLWTKNFLLMCIVSFFLFLSFFFFTSTLPLFVVQELGASENQVGLIVGLFSVTAVLIRPWSGMLLDQLGRRSIFVLSLLLYTVVISGYLLAYALWVLWVLRLLHGAVFGLTTTATATIVADEVPNARRGEGLGYYGTFMTVAMTMGPVIGITISGKWSFQVMFMTSVALSVLALVLSRWVRLQEPPRMRKSFDLRLNVREWKALLERRAMPLSLVQLSLAIVFGGVLSFVPLYAAELSNARLAGMYFMVYALALVLSRPLSGRIYDALGPDVVIYPGMLLYLTGVAMLGLAKGPLLLLTAGFVIGLGYGAIQPSLQARVIDLVEPDRRGAATATFFASIDLGIGLGAMVMGVVVSFIGYQNMFYASTAFVVLACWLYYRARQTEPAPRDPGVQSPEPRVPGSSV